MGLTTAWETVFPTIGGNAPWGRVAVRVPTVVVSIAVAPGVPLNARLA